jgi:hypothetical protein
MTDSVAVETAERSRRGRKPTLPSYAKREEDLRTALEAAATVASRAMWATSRSPWRHAAISRRRSAY